jgi:hypothetical protein
MPKNRIGRSLNVHNKATAIVSSLADSHSVDESDVINTMIRTYKARTESGEWEDTKMEEGYHVSKNKKATKYYRINESLNGWLDEQAEEYGVYKSDVLSRIILYCVARAKRGDISEEELV